MKIKEWWTKLRSKPVTDVIKHKHRFVVMDTDTFKEKFSFQLSGINLFVTVGITVIVLIAAMVIFLAARDSVRTRKEAAIKEKEERQRSQESEVALPHLPP